MSYFFTTILGTQRFPFITIFFGGRDPKKQTKKKRFPSTPTPRKKQNALGVEANNIPNLSPGPDDPRRCLTKALVDSGFRYAKDWQITLFCHRFDCFFESQFSWRLWTSKGCKKKSTAVNLLQLPLGGKKKITLIFFVPGICGKHHGQALPRGAAIGFPSGPKSPKKKSYPAW